MARKNENGSPRATRESNDNASTGRDRNLGSASSEGGRIKRFASAVRGIFQRKQATVSTTGSSGIDRELPIPTSKEVAAAGPAKQGRAPRREADVPMDAIANAYTPTQTSIKGGFRDDGRDRSRDQEFARGTEDTRWNDEDHFTNKSNDPRIGTHGRTYEAGETRDEPRE